MKVVLIAIALSSTPALAQEYLVEPTLSACQTRSAQQCAVLNCDGVQTIWWWSCVVLTIPTITGGAGGNGGAAALQIWPGTSFDVTNTNKKGTGALTGQEQIAVQSAATLAPNLPTVTQSQAQVAN
jgi:hypothetical protein